MPYPFNETKTALACREEALLTKLISLKKPTSSDVESLKNQPDLAELLKVKDKRGTIFHRWIKSIHPRGLEGDV